MIKIFGSMLCKDCVDCRRDLDCAGVCYSYLDFSENLQNLKDYLAIRDNNPLFNEVRANGAIGIPCIVREDGTITLDWQEFM